MSYSHTGSPISVVGLKV